ncbi:beta-N-acetylhexosaminidase [soil metagenome]
MTKLDGSVGDHFILGLRPSLTLADADRALLSELRPSGVIVYKSNFHHDVPYADWLASFRALLFDVRKAIGRERIFIGIDHEGGRVCRTPKPITRFAYARHWVNEAAAVGRAMGNELASLGVNLSFAPVLDVDSNPKNPVIGQRAFASDPEAVAAAALLFADALAAEGVIACGKHFPGHGDTAQDSHYALPVVDRDLEGLRARELVPFAAAARAKIPMIMTAHVMFPPIDREVPATLSRRFVHGILREELGYDGVVVSDDIGMNAVSEIFDDPTAAVRLLASGTDLLMVCSHFTSTERARGFARAITDAIARGDLDRTEVARSRARLHALLDRTPQHAVIELPADVLAIHRTAGAQFEAATVEVV